MRPLHVLPLLLLTLLPAACNLPTVQQLQQFESKLGAFEAQALTVRDVAAQAGEVARAAALEADRAGNTAASAVANAQAAQAGAAETAAEQVAAFAATITEQVAGMRKAVEAAQGVGQAAMTAAGSALDPTTAATAGGLGLVLMTALLNAYRNATREQGKHLPGHALGGMVLAGGQPWAGPIGTGPPAGWPQPSGPYPTPNSTGHPPT